MGTLIARAVSGPFVGKVHKKRFSPPPVPPIGRIPFNIFSKQQYKIYTKQPEQHSSYSTPEKAKNLFQYVNTHWKKVIILEFRFCSLEA